MQGNTTEIDERNLLRLDALLSHGYGAGQSSLVGTGTTNAVNTGLVGSATAIAKNMVIGGTELGDVDKMYQTGKSAIKGSVGAARVGSDLVKDTVDTAKTTAKAFKAGLNGEDIDLSGTKSRSGSNLAKGTKKAAKEGFRAAKRAAIKDSELEDVDNLYQEAKGLSKAAVSSTKGAVSNTRKSWKMLKRSTARIKALSGFSGGEISGFKGDMWSSVCASVALMLIVIKSGTIARDVFGG